MDETTTKKLILYYFNETDLTETVIIQRLIDDDYEVSCEYENIKSSYAFAGSCLMDPSEKSVNKILRSAMIQ